MMVPFQSHWMILRWSCQETITNMEALLNNNKTPVLILIKVLLRHHKYNTLQLETKQMLKK
jgi:hypothetical protein